MTDVITILLAISDTVASVDEAARFSASRAQASLQVSAIILGLLVVLVFLVVFLSDYSHD